jgi:hypothetical protein
MDEQIVDATLKFHIGEMRERLDRAASIARAAETCATAGNIDEPEPPFAKSLISLKSSDDGQG